MKTKCAITILLIAAIACVPARSHAQKLFFLFAHGVYNVPVDNYFNHNYNYGLGVEGGAAIGTGRTFLVVTTGYTSFQSVSGNSLGNVSYVPIKAGLRHYLLVGKILFFNVDAGVAHISDHAVKTSRFSGDVGLGVKLGPVEVIANYDGYARPGGETTGYSSWIGIKAGFRIGL